MHGHISLGQDDAWTYIFGARLCMDLYLWGKIMHGLKSLGQDKARIYVFGGKIMREHITIETNAKMLHF